MPTWALGYASKAGLAIRNEDGVLIKIGAVRVGNMHMPNPEELKEKLIAKLGAGDTVLSPSGPNFTYLSPLYATGARVFWIHTGRLNGAHSVPQALLDRFVKEPTAFYEYLPHDARVAALRDRMFSWLAIQRERVAVENALSQMMRRELDFARLHGLPNRDEWVTVWVNREYGKITRRLIGVKLAPEQQEKLKAGLAEQASRLYEAYFDPEGKIKKEDRDKVRREIAGRRLEMSGLLEDEDRLAAEVKSMLGELSENALFDGLVGEGAVRTRAQVLAFMRNPLLYPTSRALQSYAGLAVSGGQAIRRRAGQADKGNREFRRALVFDFGAYCWKKDPIGFFSALYYAYKRCQYLKYWELMALTQDVFEASGMREDDDENKDNEKKEKRENSSVDPLELKRRLIALRDLGRERGPDLIWRSQAVLEAIAELEKTDAPEKVRALLKLIFSKAGKGKSGNERPGLNLQVTQKRVENQIYRQLGGMLLKTVYYRWLERLEASLPLAQDFIYCRQWRSIMGKGKDGTPLEYDHRITLRYFEEKARRMEYERKRDGKALPDEVMQKLFPKQERSQ